MLNSKGIISSKTLFFIFLSVPFTIVALISFSALLSGLTALRIDPFPNEVEVLSQRFLSSPVLMVVDSDVRQISSNIFDIDKISIGLSDKTIETDLLKDISLGADDSAKLRPYLSAKITILAGKSASDNIKNTITIVGSDNSEVSKTVLYYDRNAYDSWLPFSQDYLTGSEKVKKLFVNGFALGKYKGFIVPVVYEFEVLKK